MSKSVIVLDADMGMIERANQKTRQSWKSAAQEAQWTFKKTTEEAGKTTKEVNRWGDDLLKKAAILGTIVSTIRAIGTEFENQKAAGVAASKSIGSSALSRAMLAKDLGVSAEYLETVTTAQGGGAASIEQRDQSLANFAQWQKSARFKATPQEMANMIAMSQVGVFKDDEIIKAKESGKLSQLMGETGARINALPAKAREEYETRIFEHQSRVRTDEQMRGQKQRIKDVIDQEYTARNPIAGGIRNVARSAALTRAFIDMVDEEGGTGSFLNSPMEEGAREQLKIIAERVKKTPTPSHGIAPENRP